MTFNGNFKEWVARGVIGLALTGAWGYLARIDGRVTEIEAQDRVRTVQMDGIARDIEEIKLEIQDIPRGSGGMTERERREFRQMAEDLSCVRGLLAGETRCPPR